MLSSAYCVSAFLAFDFHHIYYCKILSVIFLIVSHGQREAHCARIAGTEKVLKTPPSYFHRLPIVTSARTTGSILRARLAAA